MTRALCTVAALSALLCHGAFCGIQAGDKPAAARKRCQDPFSEASAGVFRGRPRGRSVLSRPSRRAARCGAVQIYSGLAAACHRPFFATL